MFVENGKNRFLRLRRLNMAENFRHFQGKRPEKEAQNYFFFNRYDIKDLKAISYVNENS